jgi:hypothetical protein
MIGKTGSGKTTLVYPLADRPLNVVVDPDTNIALFVAAVAMPGFEISAHRVSETAIPRLCRCTDTTTHEPVSVIDLPGFFDNRSPAQEIANAVCIQKVFADCPEAKLLITVRGDDLMGDRGQFLPCISTICNAFAGDIQTVASAAFLVVTGVRRRVRDEDLPQHIDDVLAQRQDLLFREQELLRSLRRKIVVFRSPEASSPSPFPVADTVTAIFTNIQRAEFMPRPRVNLPLSDERKGEALEAHNLLVGHVNPLIRGFMDQVVTAVQACAQRCSEANQATQTENDATLTSLLTRLDGVRGVAAGPDQLPTMIGLCRVIIQICGGQHLANELVQMARELEFAHSLKQFIPDQRTVSFEGIQIIQERVRDARQAIEAAQTRIAASRARNDRDQAGAAIGKLGDWVNDLRKTAATLKEADAAVKTAEAAIKKADADMIAAEAAELQARTDAQRKVSNADVPK